MPDQSFPPTITTSAARTLAADRIDAYAEIGTGPAFRRAGHRVGSRRSANRRLGLLLRMVETYYQLRQAEASRMPAVEVEKRAELGALAEAYPDVLPVIFSQFRDRSMVIENFSALDEMAATAASRYGYHGVDVPLEKLVMPELNHHLAEVRRALLAEQDAAGR